jgi:hypothetical protein
MRTDELLQQISELLEENNGVCVTNVKGNEKYSEIEFTVSDAYSRLLVFFIAEASNINLVVWCKHDPCSEESKLNPEESLIYAFRSGPNSDVTDEFNWLGAHLTWRMYRCGLINEKEEKRYCKLFNAVSRSA